MWKDILRDRVFLVCATVVMLALLAAYVLLVITGHPPDLVRTGTLITQAAVSVITLVGTFRKIHPVQTDVQEVKQEVAEVKETLNGHGEANGAVHPHNEG